MIARSINKTPSDPPLRLAEYEARAAVSVPEDVVAFVAGGAGREVTVRRNVDAFARLALRPRRFVDVGAVSTAGELLGRPLASPVLVAPTAMHTYMHPDGECGTARAARRAGTVMVVSSGSAMPLHDVAEAAAGHAWLQLYNHSREWTERLVRRAEHEGFRGLCLTVDSPVPGIRYHDLRAGFVPDLGAEAEAYLSERHGRAITARDPEAAELDLSVVTHDDLRWIRSLTALPIAVKGVSRPSDAIACVEHGIDVVIVSNHGGRALDAQAATLTELPAVVAAVAGRCPVLVDGGVRSGTDALKALALGATAVLVGRPILWGLAVAGEEGAHAVLELLRRELANAMAQCGVSALADIGADLVYPHPDSDEGDHLDASA